MGIPKNRENSEPSFIEHAKVYRHMMRQHDLSVEDLAAVLKYDVESLREVIRLLDLPGDIQARVHRGDVSFEEALCTLDIVSNLRTDKRESPPVHYAMRVTYKAKHHGSLIDRIAVCESEWLQTWEKVWAEALRDARYRSLNDVLQIEIQPETEAKAA